MGIKRNEVRRWSKFDQEEKRKLSDESYLNILAKIWIRIESKIELKLFFVLVADKFEVIDPIDLDTKEWQG